LALQRDGEDWKVFNVLHRYASQVAALDLGYKARGASAVAGKKVVYLLQADNVTAEQLQGAFVIYQGKRAARGAVGHLLFGFGPQKIILARMQVRMATRARTWRTLSCPAPPTRRRTRLSATPASRGWRLLAVAHFRAGLS
jgi:NADH dehydrogenase (ubiquinone) Fe-S protein 1